MKQCRSVAKHLALPGIQPFLCPRTQSVSSAYLWSRGDGQINAATYLAGGVDFGPPGNVVTSANLTPDANGRPAGLTLEQFQITIRTGHDPLRNDGLAVMPWPIFRHMTGRDLDAIYAYLSCIPSAVTPNQHCANAGQ